MSSSVESIPRGFARRANAAVLFVFFATMTVFLWAAYRAERGLLLEETFEHLEETSGVLGLLPELRGHPEAADLSVLEKRLAERTGIAHRVLITESDFAIAVASENSLVGEDIRTLFKLVPYGSSGSGRATANDGKGGWLASSLPLVSGDKRLFLMRADSRVHSFASRFWGLHALHLSVTVLLFIFLMKFLGDHYVRRPIEQLAAHVRRVESGEFETQPERYSDDEFGWLARRFTRMGSRLKRTVERLVRTEKAAAAMSVAYRVAKDATGPLAALKRHIAYVASLSGSDADLRAVAASLEEDRRELIQAIVRLETLGEGPLDSGADADRALTGDMDGTVK